MIDPALIAIATASPWILIGAGLYALLFLRG
jgi:hypothetical protein